MHLPEGGLAVAGRLLEEPGHRRLERDARDRLTADHRDRLADGARAHRPRGVGGVGEAQQVGGEVRIALERQHELVRGGVGVVGQRLDVLDAAIEHRQIAELDDRRVELRLYLGVAALRLEDGTAAVRLRSGATKPPRVIGPARDLVPTGRNG